jgi:hypothetical protein
VMAAGADAGPGSGVLVSTSAIGYRIPVSWAGASRPVVSNLPDIMPFFMFTQIPAASDDAAVNRAEKRIDITDDVYARFRLLFALLNCDLFSGPLYLSVVAGITH